MYIYSMDFDDAVHNAYIMEQLTKIENILGKTITYARTKGPTRYMLSIDLDNSKEHEVIHRILHAMGAKNMLCLTTGAPKPKASTIDELDDLYNSIVNQNR